MTQIEHGAITTGLRPWVISILAYYQQFDGPQSFYTTLGHIPESYNDPWFLAHIYGGIYWAATGLGVTE